MGKDSAIEWCHHTFNLGWGCYKKSSGCLNCYAERDAKRYGWDIWGKNKPRRLMSAKYYSKPLLWQKLAEERNVQERVFCGSMMDWTDECWTPMLPYLWALWKNTPNLTWLMLTKNIDRLSFCLPPNWDDGWNDEWKNSYRNVWLGITVENQAEADKKIPPFLKMKTRVRFLSCEPLLSGINLKEIADTDRYYDVLGKSQFVFGQDGLGVANPIPYGIEWIIVGGESGANRRPMDLDWARSLRDQCKDANVPFFMKQIDKVKPIPEDLMIREFPE